MRRGYHGFRPVVVFTMLLAAVVSPDRSEARVFRQILRAPLQLLGINFRPIRSYEPNAVPRQPTTAAPLTVSALSPAATDGFATPQAAFDAHIAGFVRQDHGALFSVLAPDLREPFLFVLLEEAFEERQPALRTELRFVLREHCVDEARFMALVQLPAGQRNASGPGLDKSPVQETTSNDLKLPAGWSAISELIQDKPALVRKLMDVYWRRDQTTMTDAQRRALPQQLAHGRQLQLVEVRSEDDWAVGVVRDPAPLPMANSVVAFPKRMLFKKVNGRWYVEDTRVGE